MCQYKKMIQPVKEYYIKTFIRYENKKLIQQFIREWLLLLKEFSKLPNFIRFDDEIPLLTRLNPNAKSVLVVPFENTPVYYLKNTSIFPLYPFRVQLKSHNVCCKTGKKLLIIYLKITGIKYVGFFRVNNYQSIIEQLKEEIANVRCYPPTCIKYFCKVNK